MGVTPGHSYPMGIGGALGDRNLVMETVMVKLLPVSSSFVVPTRDGNPTEFEVHAELYSKLKSLGVDVRGEITFTDKKTNEHYRFDLVIYKNGIAIELLEIKAHATNHKTNLESTRQATKYRRFGIPVTFIYGYDDANEYVESLVL